MQQKRISNLKFSPRLAAACATVLAVVLTTALTGCATVPGGPPRTAQPPALPGQPALPSQPPALTGFPDAEETQLRALIVAMRDLLRTAPDVARTQFVRRQPAFNAAQDKRWLEVAGQLGALQNLPPEQTRVFMQAQLDASNFAKRGMYATWEKEPSRLPLKPNIEQVAESHIGEVIKRFARAQPALKIPGAKAALEAIAVQELPNRNPLSEPTRKLALEPLIALAAP
jgi:hypothetical protein